MRLLCPWNSPRKNTGVGCYALHHGMFPTEGLNLCLLRLLHCRWILYCLAMEQAQAPANGTVLARVKNLVHGSELGTQWPWSSETGRAAASESPSFAMYLAGL